MQPQKDEIVAQYDAELDELKQQIMEEGRLEDMKVNVVEVRNTQSYKKRQDTEEEKKKFKIELLDTLLN